MCAWAVTCGEYALSGERAHVFAPRAADTHPKASLIDWLHAISRRGVVVVVGVVRLRVPEVLALLVVIELRLVGIIGDLRLRVPVI